MSGICSRTHPVTLIFLNRKDSKIPWLGYARLKIKTKSFGHSKSETVSRRHLGFSPMIIHSCDLIDNSWTLHKQQSIHV